MKRPMAILGISFFMSLLIASFLELKMTVVLAALLLVAFLAGLFIKSIRDYRQVMTVLLAAVAAFSMYSIQEMFTYRPLQRWDGRDASLRVETLDWVQDNNSVTVRVIGGDLPKGTRLTFWIYGADLYPEPYDILEGGFTLYTPNDKIRGYSKSNEIFLYAHSAHYKDDQLKLITPEARPFMYKILQSRRTARNTILSQKDMDETAGLITGVAFGFKDDISSAVKYNFRTIGASHLLAVSGLHVALLSQALLAFLLFLHIPRRVSLGISIAGVVFFMALTGFEPSILRAGFMCMIFLAGQMIGREPDSLNSLGASLFAITAINPYAVHDVGLLLSFASTYGLLVLYPRFKKSTAKFKENWLEDRGGWGRLFEKIIDSVMITIAATIPTLPVILLAFGQISLISPVANLLMVFPTSVVMVVTCASVPLYHAGPLRLLSAAGFRVAKIIARYLINVSEWVASIPFSSVWAGQTFLILLIPLSIGLIILGYRLLGRHGMRIAALWSVIALLCGVMTYHTLMKDVTSITILNAGNASALLLERGGRTGIIMMGEESAVNSSVQELERRNVRTADFLMMPNLNDACAFCPMILTDRIRVNCLIKGPSGEYSDTVDSLHAEGSLSWENGAVSFWNDCYAELYNGWLSVKIGKTRILVSPYQSNASDLTAGRRETNLAIFTGKSPKHASAITSQIGVLCCRSEALSFEMKAFQRDSYPLYDTTKKSVKVLTRGLGDITYKGESLIVSD